MENLPPNPTKQQVEDEKLFVFILLQSLDPQAFDYSEEKQKIESKMQELDDYLSNCSPSPPEPENTAIQNENPASSPSDRDLPSRSRPASAWSTAWEAANRGGIDPSAATSNDSDGSRKRHRHDSAAANNFDAARKARRVDASPSPSSSTPSSQDSLVPHHSFRRPNHNRPSNSSSFEASRRRMVDAQRAEQRRREQEKRDLEIALEMSREFDQASTSAQPTSNHTAVSPSLSQSASQQHQQRGPQQAQAQRQPQTPQHRQQQQSEQERQRLRQVELQRQLQLKQEAQRRKLKAEMEAFGGVMPPSSNRPPQYPRSSSASMAVPHASSSSQTPKRPPVQAARTPSYQTPPASNNSRQMLPIKQEQPGLSQTAEAQSAENHFNWPQHGEEEDADSDSSVQFTGFRRVNEPGPAPMSGQQYQTINPQMIQNGQSHGYSAFGTPLNGPMPNAYSNVSGVQGFTPMEFSAMLMGQPTMPGSWQDTFNNNYARAGDRVFGDYLRGSRSHPAFIPDDDGDDEDESSESYMFNQLARYGMSHMTADASKTREEIEDLLNNLRKDEELPPELRMGTPEEMKVILMEHQKLGLTWLKTQEESSSKGSILADDMGLGKTIQALALILARRSTDASRKTTLIVAPVALMRQWQREIADKLKPNKQLSVYIYHGARKRKTFKELAQFDVVLTTYGSLATELKKKDDFGLRRKANPNAVPTERERLSLIGDDCLWYRTILDESQCIKNRNTKTARAAWHINSIYRLCMTGTPMMNNITELYSLIAFLRIKPYNVWETFSRDIHKPISSGRYDRDRAMQRLQTLLRSILLRRTKKSSIDGKPILTLPERTSEESHATFDTEQKDFYDHLEKQTQLRVNKYLKAGTTGKNYSNMLVLLLRLRQACCHPHLIQDHGIPEGAEISSDEMEDLARKLKPQVVTMIKENEGSFECPICFDGTPNPTIFFPCGHDVCADCFTRMVDPTSFLNAESERPQAKCPECRSPVDAKKVLSFALFQKVHDPEKYRQQFTGGPEEIPEVAEEDSDTSSDSDSEVNSQGNLDGFIVNDDHISEADDESDDEEEVAKHEASEAEEAPAFDDDEEPPTKRARSKKRNEKKKRPTPKGKEKAKNGKKVTLAELKRLSQRNAKAKDRYLKRLKKDYVTSAKIDQTMAILHEVHEADPTEKVIIFSQFTTFLDFMEIPIRDAGYQYRRYDGSMSPGQRADAVEAFMDTRAVRVILVSLKAGNAGLNLNKASQVIILDPFWNPFIEEQAIDRAHRIGQQRPVRVHRVLVKDTVEDRIVALQEKKRVLINEALDESAGQQLSRLGVRELRYLFGLDRSMPS